MPVFRLAVEAVHQNNLVAPYAGPPQAPLFPSDEPPAPALPASFDGHRFSQIARLVHIRALLKRSVISEQLQRNRVQNRGQ